MREVLLNIKCWFLTSFCPPTGVYRVGYIQDGRVHRVQVEGYEPCAIIEAMRIERDTGVTSIWIEEWRRGRWIDVTPQLL